MEIGTEISQKIRSAIKAKLVELGAYVDDELPDYIMVMVANKKSQTQMTEDLGLFLGANTEKFTAWLHSLLKKLQSLTSDAPQGKEKSKPKEKNKGDKTEKRKKSTSEKSSSSSSHKASSSSTSSSSSQSNKAAPSQETKAKKSRPEEEETPEIFSISENTDEFSEELKEEEKKKPASKSVSKPTLSKSPPTKQTSSSGSSTTSKTDSKPPVAVVKKTAQDRATMVCQSSSGGVKKKPVSVVSSVKRKYEELEQEEEEYDPYNPEVGTVSSVVKVSTRRSSVPKSLQANKSLLLKAVNEAEKSVTTTKRPHPPEEREASSSLNQDTRRLPVNLKGRIKTAAGLQLISRSRRTEMLQSMKYTVDNETEEYQVKSPPLKVKADPVEFTVTNLPAKFTLKGATTVDQTGKTVISGGIENLKYTVKNEKASPPKKKMQISPTKYTAPVAEGKPSGSPKKRAAPTEDTCSLPPKRKVPTGGFARVASAALKDVAKQTQRILQKEAQLAEEFTGEVPDSRHVECADTEREALPDKDYLSSTSDRHMDTPTSDLDFQPDERIVGLGDQRSEGSNMSDGKITPDPEIQQLLERESEDDFTLADDEEDQRQQYYVEDNKRVILKETKVKDQAEDPKFIVTLDGVDLATYEQLPELLEHTERFKFPQDPDYVTELMTQEKLLLNSKPEIKALAKITPPKIKPFNISLKDTDDEEEDGEDEISPAKRQQKSLERCKFWPACANGNACPYVHPTVPCKTFPYCKFGDKCVYIHPNCKFDAKCTRKDCPFTHASKRTATPTVVHKIVQVPMPPRIPTVPVPVVKEGPPCRFFPNCRNVSCPFSHPKPCRYGTGCMNKTTCTFYHPPLPTKDKMKWSASTAAKKHISERKFDVGDAKSLPTPAT